MCRLSDIFFEVEAGEGERIVIFPTCESGLVAGRVTFASQSAFVSGSLRWNNQLVVTDPQLISASLDVLLAGDAPLSNAISVCIPPLPQWAEDETVLTRACLASPGADDMYKCVERQVQVTSETLLCATTYEHGRFAFLLDESAPSSGSGLSIVISLFVSLLVLGM